MLDAEVRRAQPRPGRPAAHVSDYLALLPSGPDAVRRLRLHRFRAAVRRAGFFIVSVEAVDAPARRSFDVRKECTRVVGFGTDESRAAPCGAVDSGWNAHCEQTKLFCRTTREEG